MRIVALGMLILLTGCQVRIGKRVEDYAPAHRAAGTGAMINTATQGVMGELLEVRDTALVVLTSDRVVLVPSRAIIAMKFDDLDVANHAAPLTPDQARHLRLLSRFPYGVPDEALRKLLASKRQTELAVVDR